MNKIIWEKQSEMGGVVSTRFNKDTFSKIEYISDKYNLNKGSVVRKIVESYFEEMWDEVLKED